MKTETHRRVYFVRGSQAPTVEVDTEAGAAYIRFRKGKVARTEVQDETGGVVVTFDFDKDGNVLGAELVGIDEFTLDSLIAKMPMLRNAPRGDARYIAAPKLQEA